jgi:alkanesulfonate monooxygenase SsuD/methylene tetrahydromethanopterin reductase-like flavin-dependent oxidoreductase (luciferase family)
MTSLGLVYDLRLPGMTPQQRADQYRVCLEQVAWADRTGFARICVREHHGVEDGYLPSPLVLAGALAAVTTSATVVLQALVVTLHDPVRIAEDLAVLDLMSAGRLVVVAGAGYDRAEHEMFGRAFDARPAEMEKAIAVLRSAWTGEPFTVDGRRVRVRPMPYQPGGPPLVLGGASASAARRAARIADGFLPVRDRHYAVYREAVQELGGPDPGPLPRSGPAFVHVADDPERAWHEIGRYCLHETNAYGALARRSGLDTGFREYPDTAALRVAGDYPILTPEECVLLCQELGEHGRLTIPALAGGMDPEISWRSLELIEKRVLPFVTMQPSPPAQFRSATGQDGS